MKKEPDDRNKLKIASFRTTDGDWFDFCQVAESNGLTATDVLKACMVEYQAGIYTPAINTPVSMRLQAAQGLTTEEVQALIDTAISTRTYTTPVNDDLCDWDELRAEVNRLRECVAQGASKEYVALVDKGLRDRLNDLWADVEALKTAVKVAAHKQSAPRTSTTTELKPLSEHEERQLKAMKANPAFLERAIEGVSNGLTGGGLTQWLADGGIVNSNGKQFDNTVGSRIKNAVLWHLANNGAGTNGNR